MAAISSKTVAGECHHNTAINSDLIRRDAKLRLCSCVLVALASDGCDDCDYCNGKELGSLAVNENALALPLQCSWVGGLWIYYNVPFFFSHRTGNSLEILG